MGIGKDINEECKRNLNKEQVLIDAGLSRNEAKVYLTLLELGPSVITTISKKTKINRPAVYDIVKRLSKKGIISYTIMKDKKFYTANDPHILLNLIRSKEEELMKIIPELLLLKRLKKEKPTALIMEGIEGVRYVTEDILISVEKGGEVLTYGCPKDISYKMRGFLGMYHKRRIAKKITQIHIYNENAKERIKYLNTLPYTQADYLPKEYDSPATTTIYADKVSFWIWEEEPLVILIKSKKMANSYRKYFWLLWSFTKLGKKEKRGKINKKKIKNKG